MRKGNIVFDPLDLRHQRSVDVVFAAYSENPSRSERGVRDRLIDAAECALYDRDSGSSRRRRRSEKLRRISPSFRKRKQWTTALDRNPRGILLCL